MTKEKSSLKIVVIGSHSTGKTTLARMLSKKFSIPMISEAARKFDKEKISNISSKEYINIQKQILDMQLEEESLRNEFISDRSTIDNAAYWIHNCSNNVKDIENINYIDKAIKNIPNYTHIFLLIPEFYPISDNFRDTNIVYQLQIAEIIHTILVMYQIKHYRITGDIKTRFDKVMEVLEQGF